MLNKKNLLVKDFIIPINKIAVLRKNSLLKEAIELMSKVKYGVCFCIKKNGTLVGVLTDGDIRRKLLNIQKPFSALLTDDLIYHINKKPKKVRISQNLVPALRIMEKNKIWDLAVVNNKNILVGMLHLHPIIKFLKKK